MQDSDIYITLKNMGQVFKKKTNLSFWDGAICFFWF